MGFLSAQLRLSQDRGRKVYRSSLHSFSVAALVGGLGLMLLGAHDARAQIEGYYSRDYNVGVRERARPDYDSLGLLLGSFQLLPTLSVTPEYDSNIFATREATADLITAIQPSATLRSNWSRHEVDAYANLTSDVYGKHSEENTTDFALGGHGRLDILTASNVTLSASYAQDTIPRTAEDTFTNSVKPVQFDIATSNLGGLQTLNRLRFSESVGVTKIDYSNTPDVTGQALSLSALNNTAVTVSGRSDYALSAALSLFATVRGNNRDYGSGQTLDQFNRSSSGYQIGLGADFDVTRLVRGQVQFGYLSQSYKSPLFRTVSGPAVHVSIDYYLTELTTLKFTADRDVIDAVDPVAISYLQTLVGFQVDHELFSNLILSARFGYQDDDFRGVQRDDHRPSVSLSSTYLLNRYVGLTAGYSFLNESSSGSDHLQGFTANVVSLSFILQL